MSDDEPLLDTNEAAQLLRRRPGFLAMMRVRGDGPTFIKMSGRVFYYRSSITTWLKSCERIKTKPHLKRTA